MPTEKISDFPCTGIYKHTCPACGHVQVFTVPLQQVWRGVWQKISTGLFG